MLLYYSTICGLYPSLYCTRMPSSTSISSFDSNDVHKEVETKPGSSNPSNDFSSSMVQPDLETTSEGLCDHIREIFCLSRQVFNDYQVKAMKKLLIRKSHPQILKEELLKQQFIVQNEKHPVYKRDMFQSSKCFEYWKSQQLANLNGLIENFSHIQIDADESKYLYTSESIVKYSDKLSSFASFYDQLVGYIFK
jgi:hypothetical protein